MSTLREATRRLPPQQRARMHPVNPPAAVDPSQSQQQHTGPLLHPPVSDQQQVVSPALKCPLPLVDAQPDGLRQFYRARLPQVRVLVPNS